MCLLTTVSKEHPGQTQQVRTGKNNNKGPKKLKMRSREDL
jgi:hypothetical protein